MGGYHAVGLVLQREPRASVDSGVTVAAASFRGSGAELSDLDAFAITRGVLANARTTGSSSSAANSLVLRDAQGNFSAGTITASLIGNASTATSASSSLLANDATRLNGQLASYYTNASNLDTGTLNINLMPTAGNWNLTGPLTVKSNALAVANSGYVGIGTASPLLPLHVAGGGFPTVQFESSSPTGMWLNLLSTGGGKYWRFVSTGSISSEGAGKLLIGHGTTQGGNSVTMTFTDSGNVGIGLSNPTARLHVAGNGAFTGSLSKGGGSFKIDHPLDPENKYLYHSFVESPDMMNVYNGTATTDGAGFATITMPDYFEALNRDFRYQLTVIDSGENDLLLARVYRKMEANAFIIKTNVPRVEVSWQVTGIRHDAWAQKNRIPNAIEKPAGEKGTLLHPEAFGQPESKGIYFTPPAAAN